MILDGTSQTIAHFIGLFNIAVEDLRARKAYHEFNAEKADDDALKPIEASSPRFGIGYQFAGFSPSVPYEPLGWAIAKGRSESRPLDTLPAKVPPVYLRTQTPDQDLDLLAPAPRIVLPAGGTIVEPPGSVVAIVVQTIQLEDRDGLSLGSHGVTLHPILDADGDFEAMLRHAADLSPLIDLQLSAESVPALIASIDQARLALAAFEPADAAGFHSFVLHGKGLDGIYVDGVLVEKAPDFDLYRPLPSAEAPETGDAADPSFRKGGLDGGQDAPARHLVEGETLHSQGRTAETSMEITTGDNLLVNAVRIDNQWLASPVVAVGVDHVELNAIIQFNAWQNIDLVGSTLADWTVDRDSPTAGLNIAEFKRIDASDGHTHADDAATSFPRAWAVTQVTGDLVILNWIEQFSFLLDNDISVLSAFGSKVTAMLGGNAASNEVSLQEIGSYYDLIFVGGSVYDVNMIQQMNLLLDNDLTGTVAGFETSGHGSIADGGNLLWNQANIVQVGAADRFSAMPDAYRKTLGDFHNGKLDLQDGVLTDSAFANLAGLRVLYITGDIVNLQYIRQTNVLGDSDQVVLARDLVQAHSDAAWTVDTGANTLVNVASVIDVDGFGKTYVGGGTYSDEILVQADFIPTDPWLSARDPNALVNEAVVFLDDDMLDGSGGLDHAPYGHAPVHAPHPDVMHTMLA